MLCLLDVYRRIHIPRNYLLLDYLLLDYLLLDYKYLPLHENVLKPGPSTQFISARNQFKIQQFDNTINWQM